MQASRGREGSSRQGAQPVRRSWGRNVPGRLEKRWWSWSRGREGRKGGEGERGGAKAVGLAGFWLFLGVNNGEVWAEEEWDLIYF